MNLASWIILGIVILIVVLAVYSVFFKKDRKGGCCDVGGKPVGCECPSPACPACSACCGRRIDFDEFASESGMVSEDTAE